MSFMNKSFCSDMVVEIENPAERFDICLTVSLDDHYTLWTAAAARLNAAGMAVAEIEDCIGPREDMSPTDCLYTLLLPFNVPGCKLNDISIRGLLPEFGELLRTMAQLPSPKSSEAMG